jgi:hypothetical protein
MMHRPVQGSEDYFGHGPADVRRAGAGKSKGTFQCLDNIKISAK